MPKQPFTPCLDCQHAFESWNTEREAEIRKGVDKLIKDREPAVALWSALGDPKYANVNRAINAIHKGGRDPYANTGGEPAAGNGKPSEDDWRRSIEEKIDEEKLTRQYDREEEKLRAKFKSLSDEDFQGAYAHIKETGVRMPLEHALRITAFEKLSGHREETPQTEGEGEEPQTDFSAITAPTGGAPPSGKKPAQPRSPEEALERAGNSFMADWRAQQGR